MSKVTDSDNESDSWVSFHVTWNKAGHDPSQILMKLFSMKGIYEITLS